MFLSQDDINYVEPDLSVICNSSKLDEKGCRGAPDWIVDPEKQMTTVYGFEKDTMEQYDFGEEIPVGIYEGFSLRIQ